MQTYTGIQFWPLDPRIDEICIEDIAHSLAMQTRYAGHCKRFYSVAEHSVHVSRAAKTSQGKKGGLLHDSPEAYVQDIVRPVKPYLSGYTEIEDYLSQVISVKYGVTYPWVQEVHELDEMILVNERDQNMSTPPADWELRFDAIPGLELEFWSPQVAEQKFLERFRELFD